VQNVLGGLPRLRDNLVDLSLVPRLVIVQELQQGPRGMLRFVGATVLGSHLTEQVRSRKEYYGLIYLERIIRVFSVVTYGGAGFEESPVG